MDSSKIGAIIGSLGFVDELTSVVTAPVLGTLCDRMDNAIAVGRMPRIVGGAKMIQCLGFFVIGVSLIGYGELGSNKGQLFVLRSVFAMGVTACLSMVTVMLNELANSDFTLRFWTRHHRYAAVDGALADEVMHEEETPERVSDEIGDIDGPNERKNGKYAAFIGISTGLGAVFAVSCLLTLPINLVDWLSLSIKDGLQFSYLIIGSSSLVVAFVLLLFLYDSTKQDASVVPQDLMGYFKLLHNGILLSKDDFRIQLAYIGSFVSRSTTVANSVFIPLLVYNFYYKSGQCDSDHDVPSKQTCHDGYVFAAILTGVSQTVALCSAPLWAYLIDNPRIGNVRSLFVSSAFGMAGCFGLCIMGSGSKVYDPRTVGSFVIVSFIGLSQTGVIITSMSFISSLKKTSTSVNTIGSISGLYSLSGGIGILIITKLGGMWSDYWILAPFFVLGLFNVVLAAASKRHM